jgi:hypothetical protein
MPDYDLTPVQRSVLLILMAEAREVPNADLKNNLKVDLKRERRDGLKDLDLIKVREEKRRLFLELTDRGWAWCSDQDGLEVPAGMGHGGAAAYAMLAGLRRNLHRHGSATVPELFGRYGEPALPVDEGVVASTDIESLIRKAYQELTTGPGSWVKLADLRPVLGGLAKSEVDRVFIEMNRKPDVSIVPESNQKALTDRDWAAAVQIGNQDKHLIAIGP